MSSEFVTFAVIGALAQLIDGSLGMAFGVASAAMLLSVGLPPAAVSASVHYAETFTCGASGISHLVAGNVRRRLFFSLMIPGVIGAVLGAYIVSHVPATWMRLALTPYFLGMGVFLLLRAHRNAGHSDEVLPGTRPLGFIAGFADAIAGGGWSALTVTSLVARGNTPRLVIGTTHLAKCVVSASASITFLIHVGASHGLAVLGLILGGALASPFSALFAKVMPARMATVMAAIAVLGLGLSNVVKAFQ